MTAGIIFNISILIVLNFIFIQIYRFSDSNSIKIRIVEGLIFGCMAVATMMTPISIVTGVIIDVRTVIISAAGFIGGPITAVVCFIVASGCRLFIGGVGTSAGLLTIFNVALAGVLFHRYHERRKIKPGLVSFFFVGVVSQLVAIPTMLLLPADIRMLALKTIAPYMMIIYPFVSMLFLKMIYDQKEYFAAISTLRESEKKYRDLVEIAQEGIWVIDKENNTRFVNHSMANMLGYTPEEMNGRPLFDFMDEEGIKIAENNIYRRQRGLKEQHDFEFIRKDGRRIYTTIVTAPIFDAKGNYNGATAGIIDITERKQAENEVKQTAKRLREAQRIARVGDWEWIPATDTVTWSEQLYRIFGFDPAKPPPGYLKQLELYHPEDAVLLQKAVADTLEKGTPYELEMRRTGTNGEVSHLLVHGEADQDESGKVTRLYGSVQDITMRKRNEMALREGRAKLEGALESMADAVFISDAAGQFIEFNKAFATFHRFENKSSCLRELDDYPGILDVYLPDGKPLPMEMWVVNRALRGETGTNEEYRLKRKDTGESWIGSYNFAPILDEKGSIVGSVVVARDITERKYLQAQLQQAQKMDSIGTLAGGIAHDFNNMLSSIIGFTELSLDDVEKGTPVADHLTEIYTAGMRAKDLVKQILVFSRQSGEEKKPIQVDIIAEESLKLIRSTIPTSIAIRKKIDSNSIIMANPTMVHQLFINLCANAAQAMDSNGGILEVCLKDIEINSRGSLHLSGLKPGSYIEIIISDTGPGINPDIIDSIFEPFFTTKDVGEGTGMGLAVVHGIVESIGGKIFVDSKPEKGAVFSIYLPITKKREASSHYESKKLPSGAERILFVDDEPAIVKMASQVLENLGYQVVGRTSSVSSLELFRSEPDDFDLVITDMTMPDLSGDQLAREMMKIRPDIPVILCTGYSNKISDETASGVGIKAFAYKPVSKSDLANTVRKVLDEALSSAQ